MPLEAYSPCPCGSGKKFKWCCQDFYPQVMKALELDIDGQHEAALRAIEEVIQKHADNPEVWGQKALLLFRNRKLDEAEQVLQKAFALNANYGFGHYLQGMFRKVEGEIPGALLLFRKAAEVLDPEARDLLAEVHSQIADCELRLNRPVAMHAALRIAHHLDPADEELRQVLAGYFGPQSRLPSSARQQYSFMPPSAALPAEKRQAWDAALGRASTGKLGDAARAFAELAQGDPSNAAAWYNLGVARAWLGDNRGALDALDRYVEQESDAAKAAGAWALGQVLRHGNDMEPEADVLEHSVMFRVADPRTLSACLQDWQRQRRMLVLEASQEDGIFSLLVLELPVSLAGTTSQRLPRLGAQVLIVRDRIRLWHTNAESLGRVRDELLQKAPGALADERPEQHTANLSDVLASAVSFPVGLEKAEAQDRVREEFGRYFEETWIHQPLRSLSGAPPVDAAGHAVLRKKLAGVILFLEEAASVAGHPYDFNQLRRKLGLLGPPVATPAAGPDIAAMGAAELAALPAESLNDDQLEQAYQGALKLDAREVAGRFAKLLIARPPNSARLDRFPWYSHLVQLALDENNTDAALDYVNEGLKADCEHNEGRRRNDYEQRRGRIHVKRGEFDQAQEVFDRLIERVPSELKYRGTAAETMLSARQPSRALHFAQAGLAKAREQNDRDSEQYFLELLEAAKKQA